MTEDATVDVGKFDVARRMEAVKERGRERSMEVSTQVARPAHAIHVQSTGPMSCLALLFQGAGRRELS